MPGFVATSRPPHSLDTFSRAFRQDGERIFLPILDHPFFCQFHIGTGEIPSQGRCNACEEVLAIEIADSSTGHGRHVRFTIWDHWPRPREPGAPACAAISQSQAGWRSRKDAAARGEAVVRRHVGRCHACDYQRACRWRFLVVSRDGRKVRDACQNAKRTGRPPRSRPVARSVRRANSLVRARTSTAAHEEDRR